jgi:hypothetical protein
MFVRISALAKRGHVSVTSLLAISFLALVVLAPPGSCAQNPAPSAGAATVKGRYLIVVETSKAMERRALGVLEGVRELLFTGMRGQLREGDSIGIWTFNDQLQTGKFPLQTWSAKNSRQIAVLALEFLQSQNFEKDSALQNALAAMHGVVSNSAFITIALVTTGNESISGTPFDAAINQTFKNWQNGQQKKQMPMMTILRARKGQYTDFAVTPLPFPIDIPPYPADLVATQALKPIQTNKPAPGPLIVTGPKRQPTEAGAPRLPPPTSSVPNLIVRSAAKSNVIASPPAISQTTNVTPAASPETSSTGAAKPGSTNEVSPTLVVAAAQPNPAVVEPTLPVAKTRAAESVSPPLVPVKAQPLAESAPVITNPVVAVQTAVASPAGPGRKSGVVRIAALTAGGLAVAVLLICLYLRRSPPVQRPSLITRSLEQEQK